MESVVFIHVLLFHYSTTSHEGSLYVAPRYMQSSLDFTSFAPHLLDDPTVYPTLLLLVVLQLHWWCIAT